ncbi:Beta-keratin-related protein, partial [Tauraco erythrolophus]
MSCFRPCPPRPCGTSGPTPLASSCSEPCVARCADSTVGIQAPPVV